MTVLREADGAIRLSGTCGSEDAEVLLRRLLETPEAVVDWRACTALHGAVLQVLLCAQTVLRGPPADGLLQRWVEPLLPSR